MSKYTEMQTQMTSHIPLMEALTELGMPCTYHETPVALKGFSGTDVRMAHVVVTKKIGYGQLGFLKDGATFRQIVDDIDIHRLGGTRWEGRLMQKYTKCRTVAMAKAKGYRFVNESTVDGKLQLQFAAR